MVGSRISKTSNVASNTQTVMQWWVVKLSWSTQHFSVAVWSTWTTSPSNTLSSATSTNLWEEWWKPISTNSITRDSETPRITTSEINSARYPNTTTSSSSHKKLNFEEMAFRLKKSWVGTTVSSKKQMPGRKENRTNLTTR